MAFHRHPVKGGMRACGYPPFVPARDPLQLVCAHTNYLCARTPHPVHGPIETRLATLERIAPDILEIRYKPEQKLDTAGLREVLDEWQRLCPEGPYKVLAVFPPESDFDLGVMMEDHYRGRGLESCTAALAIAAQSTMMERMVDLYYAYFPQRMTVGVFVEEKEARAWLRAAATQPALN